MIDTALHYEIKSPANLLDQLAYRLIKAIQKETEAGWSAEAGTELIAREYIKDGR